MVRKYIRTKYMDCGCIIDYYDDEGTMSSSYDEYDIPCHKKYCDKCFIQTKKREIVEALEKEFLKLRINRHKLMLESIPVKNLIMIKEAIKSYRLAEHTFNSDSWVTKYVKSIRHLYPIKIKNRWHVSEEHLKRIDWHISYKLPRI